MGLITRSKLELGNSHIGGLIRSTIWFFGWKLVYNTVETVVWYIAHDNVWTTVENSTIFSIGLPLRDVISNIEVTKKQKQLIIKELIK